MPHGPSKRASGFLPRLAALVLAVLAVSGTLPRTAATALGAPVAVVYGERSVRPADVNYSRSLSRNFMRWARTAGLDAEEHSDADIAAALAPDTQVAHLLSLHDPPPETLAAIRGFLGRGGKIAVYNSASPELGELLGVEVGGHVTAPRYGAFGRIHFVQRIPNCPFADIRQRTGAFREGKPAKGGGATPIAFWHSATGAPTRHAAVLLGGNGYWFGAPLLDNADGKSRVRLVAAVTGALAPRQWPRCAATLYSRLGQSIGCNGFPAAVEMLHKNCPPARRPQLAQLMRGCEPVYVRLREQARTNSLGAQSANDAWLLEDALAEGYALLQTPWQDAACAVWDQEGCGLYPGDWDRTCRTLAACGVTDLFVYTASPTTTHATVPGLVQSPLRKAHGDQLAAAVAAGHRHGLRVHAWIAALSAEGGNAARIAELAKSNSLMVDADGRRRDWLDPRLVSARALLASTACAIARRYDVDGIHLDYIRYPSYTASQDDAMRRDFEAWLRRKCRHWPDDVRPADGRWHAKFVEYRARNVEAAVREVRANLRDVRPNVILTAAVLGKHPQCIASVGQDWKKWLRDGIVDWVLPMNYTDDPAKYGEWLAAQAADPALRGRILTGIGVTSAECRLRGPQVFDQIQAARRLGFGGYAFFDLDETLLDEVLQYLRLGIAPRRTPNGIRQ